MIEKQQRDTKQRRLVYETVKARKDHPTADDIYTDVRLIDPHISKGTVYRNLNILVDKGDIVRLSYSGADRYDCNLNEHYHIMCTVCGRVEDAPVAVTKDGDSIVEKETGFRIKRHWTLFEGICPECLGNPLNKEAI